MLTKQSKIIGLISFLLLTTSVLANPLAEIQHQAKIANDEINLAMHDLRGLPGYGHYVQLTRELMQEVVAFRNRMENYMSPDELAREFQLVQDKYLILRDKFRADLPAQRIPPLSDSFYRIRESVKRVQYAVKRNGGDTRIDRHDRYPVRDDHDHNYNHDESNY